MTEKKRILIASIITILISFVVSIVVFSAFTWVLQSNRYDGIYYPIPKLMSCKVSQACVHELMHYMDDRLDWPSEDFEFLMIADTLKYKNSIIMTMEFRSKQTININHEFYARLFTYYYTHRDEVPDEFASFYDWNIIDGLSIEPGYYWLGYHGK